MHIPEEFHIIFEVCYKKLRGKENAFRVHLTLHEDLFHDLII